MMGSRMMLGEVIGPVDAPFLPVDMESALAKAVTNPVELHVRLWSASV